ncbi:MAG: adenylosuccinate synthase [Candidatus Anstonellaceae archaeon]
MGIAAIVGAQWGDEGKGKVVDFYASKAHIVVRFNGGANAGHTIVHKGTKYKFHHLPSGSLYKGKVNIIGNGMVVDPKKLLEEIEQVKACGSKLMISPRAHVVLPYHFFLDGAEEEAKGWLAAGTTKRGIGPCYSDKAARIGIRMGEFVNPEIFKQKLRLLHTLKTAMLQHVYNKDFPYSEEQIFLQYSEYASRLAKYVQDPIPFLQKAIQAKRNILLEGAQATMLDIDFGLYPFGTSSSTTAAGACIGSGIPPSQINHVIGVVKLYTSRVGSGPLPTEITDSTADFIRNKGGEFGTTTGRPRRVGWLDLVTLRFAAAVNGFTGLALTRLDTLSDVKNVKVCTHYLFKGKKLLFPPSSYWELSECKPVYAEFDGWEDLGPKGWSSVARKGFFALPKNAREYLTFISRSLGIPIVFVGVGESRQDAIVLKEIFK